MSSHIFRIEELPLFHTTTTDGPEQPRTPGPGGGSGVAAPPQVGGPDLPFLDIFEQFLPDSNDPEGGFVFDEGDFIREVIAGSGSGDENPLAGSNAPIIPDEVLFDDPVVEEEEEAVDPVIGDLFNNIFAPATPTGVRGSASFGSIFPPGVLEGLQQLFQLLLTNPGIPPDVMNRAQSFNRAEILGQERRRIQRRSSEFSGRGLFGSGIHAGNIRDIEREAQTEIGRSSTALSLEDARLADSGRRLASGLGLGLGQAGLDVNRLNLAETLGLGDLDLRRLGLEISKALEEARLNLLINESVLGGGGALAGQGVGSSSSFQNLQSLLGGGF